MRLSELVRTSDGGLVPVGRVGVDPQVTEVITSDMLDPRRYLSGGELVLTGLAWWQPDRPGRSRGFVAALVGGGAVALAAGDAELGSVPDDLVAACTEAGLPLLRVPVAYSFAAVIERASRQLSGHDDLGAVLAHHRALIAAVAAREATDSGLAGILDVVAADLGLTCEVLSPSGRVLASCAAHRSTARSEMTGESATLGLGDAARRMLARQFLKAPRLPTILAQPPAVSVFAAGPPGPRAASWILAVAGDHTTWSTEQRTVVAELASLVALEAELSQRGSPSRRLLTAAMTGTSSGEVERACRANGLDPTRAAVVVFASGPLARIVLTEALATGVLSNQPLADEPLSYVDDDGGRWALADLDGDVVAVAAGAGDLVGRIRAMIALLKPGLGAESLRVGVSDAVTGGAGLLGGLAEARAAAMTGDPATPHSVAGSDHLSSHALLLAAVPVELREAYRARVLGPLLEHDRVHHTDLVRTLRMYLDSSGSWSRCAAEMHVHVNTLRYRMQRISALTGRDLRRLSDQTDLLLALNLP